MGREITVAAERRGHRRVAELDRDEMAVGRFGVGDLQGATVAFEFSEPAAARENVRRLLQAGCRVVCGTTGWSVDADMRREADAGGLIVASNFSVGMQLFYRAVRRAARELGRIGGYDPFLIERHHRGKVDAPSGTARRLTAILLEEDPGLERVQEGNPAGRLPAGTLHVTSVRAGHEPGTHTLGWDGAHDGLTLEHRARSRGGFAEGAVRAGEWLETRNGYHEFDEVLRTLLERDENRAGGRGDREERT